MSKKNKTVEDVEALKIIAKYLKNVEAMLPKTKINTKDDLDDDEQEKNEHKSSSSNPSQSSKATGSKGDDKKKEKEEKKSKDDGIKKKRGGEGITNQQKVQGSQT